MKIRDSRVNKRFFVDNVIVTQFGKILGPHGIAVYCSLCKFADKETQTCFPSYKTIGDLVGVSRSQVGKSLKQMKELGLVTWKQDHREDKGQTSNIYYLLDPPVHPVDTPKPQDGQPPIHPVDTNNPQIEQSPPNIPAAEPQGQTDYFSEREEPEYTPVEEEEKQGSSRRGIPPKNAEEKRWVEAHGASTFAPGQVSKVRGIIASKKRGEAMAALVGEAQMYRKVLEEISSVNQAPMNSAPPVLPVSWYEDRLANAEKHNWSRWDTINYTLNREKLIAHCRKMLRALGASAEDGKQPTTEEYAKRAGLRVIR